MKEMIRIFVIITFIEIVIVGLVLYYFSGPISYVPYEACGFSCEIPEGSKIQIVEEDSWHQHHFVKQGQGSITINHTDLFNTPEYVFTHLEKSIGNPNYSKSVNVYDNGKFYLLCSGKSTRRYIYIFTVGEEVFWMESRVGFSTLRIYKDSLDHLLETFVYHGEATSSNLKTEMESINPEIVKYSQELTFLLLFILAITVGAFALAIILMGKFSKMPDLPGEIIKRKAEGVYIVIKGPFARKGTMGWIALTETELLIKPLSLKLQRVGIEDLRNTEILHKRNKKYLIVKINKWTYQIALSNALMWDTEIKSMI